MTRDESHDRDCGASPRALDAEAETRVLQAIRSLSYGSVEVTVHAGEVVQIERKEKVRIGRTGPAEAGRKRR